MRSTKYLEKLLKPIAQDLGYEWPQVSIEPPSNKKFGDLACNLAMVLASQAKTNPRALAEKISDLLKDSSEEIAKVDVAGPGFLNISFRPSFWQKNLKLVAEEKDNFGSSDDGKGQKVQVEYVSANPTGPLHIGHGRGAAIGDSTARILRFAGYEVETEYYINDAGLQMHTLGLSIWLRLLEKTGEEIVFPDTCYQGAYIKDIAQDILEQNPKAGELAEKEGIDLCYKIGLETILEGIKNDLAAFKVEHQHWFSELSLVESDEVAKSLAKLEESGYAYEKDEALWFRTTVLGDDKDRVLRKSDGSLTYFASDIAYHANKYQRGFNWLIDVWGADHHGYIPRVKAAIKALDKAEDSFSVILVQLVDLIKNGEQVAMSTRAGKFETLAEVVEEVGTDAARFIFLSRKSDSKLEFDLDLVKQRTMENPVYYVQYAHARVCALMRRAKEQEIDSTLPADICLLDKDEELDILKALDKFPQIVKDAASSLSPHFVSYFLMDLAGLMHKYYAIHKVLDSENPELSLARLTLLQAAGQTIKNGLKLLGVSAPEVM